MKNLEWGSVAYMSHSKYGKNREVGSGREYSTYRTGMSTNYTYNDFYISYEFMAISQCMRIEIAKDLKIDDKYDWHTYDFNENVISTIKGKKLAAPKNIIIPII